ncbi:MFS transporter [Chloroflexota bacterium]
MPSILNSFSTVRKQVRGIFYGWWIVLSCCVLQLMRVGLLNQGFTVYFLPLEAEFGWSRALLSSGYSLTHVETGILGPLEGWLTDRFGSRIIVIVGLVFLGAGFVLLSMVHSIVAYYVAFIVIAAGSSLSGFLPLQVAILNWFIRKRSLALGIAMAGAGLAGIIVPILAWSLTTYG